LNEQEGKGEGGKKAVKAIDGLVMTLDANEVSLTLVALSCSVLMSDVEVEQIEMSMVSQEAVIFGWSDRVRSG